MENAKLNKSWTTLTEGMFHFLSWDSIIHHDIQQNCGCCILHRFTMFSWGTRVQTMDRRRLKGTYEGLIFLSFISCCSLLAGVFACNWGPPSTGHCMRLSRTFRVLLPCLPQHHHREDPHWNSRCTCTIPPLPWSISRCRCCSHIVLTMSALAQALHPTYTTFWCPEWLVLINYREQAYQGCKGALEMLESLQCTWSNAADQPAAR